MSPVRTQFIKNVQKGESGQASRAIKICAHQSSGDGKCMRVVKSRLRLSLHRETEFRSKMSMEHETMGDFHKSFSISSPGAASEEKVRSESARLLRALV
jgi:hypothetical protein